MNDMRLDIENSPELAVDLADAYAVHATTDQMQRMIFLISKAHSSGALTNGIAIESFLARLRAHWVKGL